MCKAMEELCNERAKEAARYEKLQIAVNLLNRGKDTFKEIAVLTGLTLEEVHELAKELDNVTS